MGHGVIKKWIIVEPKGNVAKGCLLALPGRNIPGDAMESFCNCIGLDKSLLVVLEPDGLQWYPAPMGPTNQYSAVNAIKEVVSRLDVAVDKIERDWLIKRNKIGIVGFSAGAVVALQMVATSVSPFAGVVSLGGAVLEPDKLAPAPTKTPVLIQANKDDETFKWTERYEPMKAALMKQGYNLFLCERETGGHSVCPSDAKLVNRFLREHLGYTAEKKNTPVNIANTSDYDCCS